ncbi:MAG: HEAT repeat domain-containing protein [Methanoregula sp.]|nr:HEAT repeat domain-containing protein [Methanoregula sp.]
MTKEPIIVYLPSFSWKTPEEFQIKKAIADLDRPFPEQVVETIKFLKKAGKAVLPYMQEAMEEKQFEENLLWDEVPKVFANIGEPAIPVLINWLAHEDEYFYDTAEEALEMIGKPAVPALCKAITNPDAEVRMRIISVLEKTKDASALPYLITALSDADKYVGGCAQDAIIAIKPSSSYNQIVPLLTSDDLRLVCSAISLLPAINRKKGIAEIMPFFSDTRDEVWDAVYDSLQYLQPPPVSELLKFLSDKDPQVIVGAMNVLVSFKDKKTIPSVEPLLNHPDENVRECAVWCIAELRGESTEMSTE